MHSAHVPDGRRFVLLVALVGAAALGATVTNGSASTAGEAGDTPSAVTTAVVTTVGVIESELAQLADGRAKLKGALGGVAACTLPPSVAGARLVEVIANRTGISRQLATLPAPTAEAAHVKALLRSALDHSLAADRHYRNWVVFLGSRPRCSTTTTAELTAAQREDVLATAAKQHFVAVFNPLARRLHLRAWEAAAI